MSLSIVVRNIRKYKRNPAKHLQSIISHTHWGRKFAGVPKHCNTNDSVARAYNNGLFLPRLTQKKIKAHQRGEATFYFCGAQRVRDKETLVMIDIDCHKEGTLQGAVAFAKHLQTIYPNLYYETSTNGNGVHAYLIIKKDGVGPGIVNQGIERLQAYLRTLTDGFDIELVEVKGKCPEIDWDRNGRVTNVKAGTLAKLPRGDIQGTHTLDYTDLLKLPTTTRATAPAPDRENRKESLAGTRKIKGSASQSLITAAELANMPHYRKMAASLMNQAEMPTKGRQKVTTEDVAIFLMLGKFFTNNPADGSIRPEWEGTLPQKRWNKLWSKLYADGEISRSFDDKRFKAIRDLFSSLGLLTWEDNTFVIGSKRDGVACKWSFSPELMGILDTPQDWENRRASLAGTVETIQEQVFTLCVLNLDYEQPTLRAFAIRPENWYLAWTPDNLTTEIIAA